MLELRFKRSYRSRTYTLSGNAAMGAQNAAIVFFFFNIFFLPKQITVQNKTCNSTYTFLPTLKCNNTEPTKQIAYMKSLITKISAKQIAYLILYSIKSLPKY